ncbi:hypothetical protein GCM10010919_11580 [Alishewanella longhuensis]|uniref:HDOD domain-containing protein n=1 Tax=Alishewanella longhuensis TaxID=1091037 RepID=A0ABQ3KVV2_9ALTE|nr:hypothetical protein [Alishewanella longhuensis]GHG64756.1 hypothetical protein GCM10010919_11580 [Alishewanella longhuensis]
MPDLLNNWLICYQQLSTLSAALQQADTAEQLQGCLQLSREINTKLQQLVDENPGMAIAQLSIIESNTTTAISQAIKCWVLLAFWSRLKHWPNARRDIIGGCALLAACTIKHSKRPAALQLAALLKNQQSGGIFTAVLAGTYHQQQKRFSWQVHQDSPLLTLALDIAEQLQPDDNSARALEQVLAFKISNSTDEFELAQLNILAQLAPTLYLSGRLAIDQLERYWLLCHADGQAYQALQYWPEQEKISDHLSAKPLAELNLLPPARLALGSWLSKIHIKPLATQKIPTPSSLIANSILTKLSYHDFDAQLKLVEKHPILVQFLLDNASESNRRQTLIHRLRHALAIFGQEQLPLAVARAEVLQYLQLQSSTQHAWLSQLQHTLQFSIQLVGRYLPQPLNLQQAGLIAACCSAPLWHHPSLQAVPLSKMQQNQLLLGQLCQSYLLEPVRSQRLSAALLKHYQLDDWAVAVLSQYQQPQPGQVMSYRQILGVFLHLCWQLTFSVFCYPSAQQSSKQLLRLAAQYLPLPQQPLDYWQQELLNCQQLYYPLDSQPA